MAEMTSIHPGTGVTVGSGRVLVTRYVDWPSVLAGTVIAATMAILLITFGSAVGLSVVSPWSGDLSAQSVGIATAIWTTLVQIYAAAVGAYFAARLRPPAGDSIDPDEIRFRDGANGLVVWALSFMLAFALMYSAVSGIVRGAAAAASAASAVTTSVASSIGDASAFAIDRAADQLMRGQGGQPTAQGGAGGAQTAAPQRQLQLPSVSPETRAEIRRAIQSIVMRGELPQQDKAYLQRLLVDAGIEPEQAAQRIEETINSMIANARQVTEATRRTAAASAFWMTFAMLVAGFAAWWSGTFGGSHRDRAIPRTSRT
ncbi:MAG: hypothetical protein R3D27_11800 [Hyphomicrobiaceae bacterium]